MKTLMNHLYDNQSDAFTIKCYLHMDKIYSEMAWNDPKHAIYAKKFEAMMLYMLERFGEKRFCNLIERLDEVKMNIKISEMTDEELIEGLK